MIACENMLHDFTKGRFVTFTEDAFGYKKGDVRRVEDSSRDVPLLNVEEIGNKVSNLVSYTSLRASTTEEIEGFKQAEQAVLELVRSRAFFLKEGEFRGYKSYIEAAVPSLKDKETYEVEIDRAIFEILGEKLCKAYKSSGVWNRPEFLKKAAEKAFLEGISPQSNNSAFVIRNALDKLTKDGRI